MKQRKKIRKNFAQKKKSSLEAWVWHFGLEEIKHWNEENVNLDFNEGQLWSTFHLIDWNPWINQHRANQQVAFSNLNQLYKEVILGLYAQGHLRFLSPTSFQAWKKTLNIRLVFSFWFVNKFHAQSGVDRIGDRRVESLKSQAPLEFWPWKKVKGQFFRRSNFWKI